MRLFILIVRNEVYWKRTRSQEQNLVYWERCKDDIECLKATSQSLMYSQQERIATATATATAAQVKRNPPSAIT
jgi:hypothetical protein